MSKRSPASEAQSAPSLTLRSPLVRFAATPLSTPAIRARWNWSPSLSSLHAVVDHDDDYARGDGRR